MAYVPVPKDLNAVKTKVLLNLTKRQLVCFGAGAALGVPLFFLLKAHTGVSTAAICMILLMLPFFLLAMYEKNGQPLEKIVRNIVQVCFLRPKQRPYATNNFYAVLERQDNLDREVYRMQPRENLCPRTGLWWRWCSATNLFASARDIGFTVSIGSASISCTAVCRRHKGGTASNLC